MKKPDFLKDSPEQIKKKCLMMSYRYLVVASKWNEEKIANGHGAMYDALHSNYCGRIDGAVTYFRLAGANDSTWRQLCMAALGYIIR